MLLHFFSDATNTELYNIANQLNESIITLAHSLNVMHTMFNQMSNQVDGLAASVSTIESQQTGKLMD